MLHYQVLAYAMHRRKYENKKNRFKVSAPTLNKKNKITNG